MQPEGFALSRGVALGSVGLGLAELAAPRTVLRAKGAGDVALGLGLLLRPRRPVPMWLRVAADALGAGALAVALANRDRRGWVIAGLAASAAALAVDVWAARRIARAHERAMSPVTASVTIARPVDEVYTALRELDLPRFLAGDDSIEWEADVVEDRAAELVAWCAAGPAPLAHRGQLAFTRAPGGGTEIRATLALAPLGVAPSILLAKVFARPVIAAALGRLKQLMEAGEILEVWP